MTTSTRRLLGGFAIAAVLLLGQGGFVRAADPSANPSTPPTPLPSGLTGNEMLSVTPSVLNLTAKPGATATAKLTVRAAADLAVTISPQGLGETPDGNMGALVPDKDTGKYTARSMITATPASLTMKPGDKVTVNVTVAVPADAGEGSRYAILSITGLPPSPSGSATNVGFGIQLGVSAIVQLIGTAQNKTGEISNITLGKSLPGQALPITASFLNTGNTHFGAIPDELTSTATLQDATGAELATGTASGTNVSLLPGFTRDLGFSLSPSKALVDGAKYHVEVGVGLKDGAIFDRKALDFTWSGGGAVTPTSAPIQTPPVAAPVTSPDPMLLVVIAALGSAGIVALLFLLVPRLRRRPRQDGGVADK